MKVALFGDTHGEMGIHKLSKDKFPEQKEYTEDDMIVILGDFGLYWANSDTDRYWLQWLGRKRCKIVVVPGNHENYEMIFNFPVVPFMGDYAYQGGRNIFILKRGGVFTFGSKLFFAMGGAFSIDKERRQDRISWWSEEEPSFMEWKYGFDNLAKVNNKVDYIITHDISEAGRKILYNNDLYKQNSVSVNLEVVRKNTEYKEWYCGHHHLDQYLPEVRTQILYSTHKVLEV